MQRNVEIEKAVESIVKGFSIMFEEAVRSAVGNVIQAHLESNSLKTKKLTIKPEDDFIDINGAIKITNYTRSTIYDYVAKKRIPHQKVNRKLIFSRKELLKWIKESN